MTTEVNLEDNYEGESEIDSLLLKSFVSKHLNGYLRKQKNLKIGLMIMTA